MIMMLLGFALPYIVVLMHLPDKKNGNMDETKTQSALQMFLRATRSQARSSDQTRPTALASPLVTLLRISEPPYANSKTSL